MSDLSKLRFVLWSGLVRSTHDKDIHFITCGELMRCYGLRKRDCIMIPLYEISHSVLAGSDKSNLIHLSPLPEGDYESHLQKQIANWKSQ